MPELEIFIFTNLRGRSTIFLGRRNNDNRSKILIIGDSGVGKTSLRHRYIKGNFRHQELMTLGVEYSTSEVNIDGEKIILELYDIAGQDTIELQKKLIKNIKGAIVVFDLTRHETFFALRSWIDKIYQHNPKSKAPLFIIGNKNDLKSSREIPKQDLEKLVSTLKKEKEISSHSIKYFETSAKTGENTESVFTKMARILSKAEK